ncbi:selenite/tellurite reduction operon protein ExtJ [Thermosulfuriphilus sp.]
MKKKVLAFVLATTFMMGSSGMALAAKRCKGTVVKIEGEEMVVQLKGKCKIKEGTKVTIKAKKTKAIEGC